VYYDERACWGSEMPSRAQPSANRTDFLNIQFGYASAEREGADAPELLLNGFLDHGDVGKEALTGGRFLFLGYKGSGKSAIGERARLLAQGDPMLFVSQAGLADFPFDVLHDSLAIGDDGSSESGQQNAWSWILLLRLLQSIRTDEAAAAEDIGFHRSLDTLTRFGLLPASDLRTMVLTSSNKQFKLQLPKLAEAVMQRQYESPQLALNQLVSHLRDLVSQFKSEARHVLVVDGLDEVLSLRQQHYNSIASLLLAVTRLNSEFSRWGAPVKIVILCRSDLFERLPGANKNKMRQDWAVTLDWYHDPSDPESSGLLQLANLRAALALGHECSIISRFFPPTIREGEIRRFLLDHTRHTPRDFGQLLTSIQHVVRSSAPSRGPTLTRDQIISGLRDYSISYFLPEIKDELNGYMTTSDIERMVATLAATRKREFLYQDLTQAAESVGASDLDLEEAVRALFECSALGVIQRRRQRSGRDATYFTFKYRNRNSSVAMNERFILHRGVWKALNLV
jgi:hypothetical protein